MDTNKKVDPRTLSLIYSTLAATNSGAVAEAGSLSAKSKSNNGKDKRNGANESSNSKTLSEKQFRVELDNLKQNLSVAVKVFLNIICVYL